MCAASASRDGRVRGKEGARGGGIVRLRGILSESREAPVRAGAPAVCAAALIAAAVRSAGGPGPGRAAGAGADPAAGGCLLALMARAGPGGSRT